MLYDDWLSTLSDRGDGIPILRRFIQSVLMYTSWEIRNDINKMVFENEEFLPDNVALTVIVVVKEFGCSRENFLFLHLMQTFDNSGSYQVFYSRHTSHSGVRGTSPLKGV